MNLVSISDFRKKIKFYVNEVLAGHSRVLIQKHKKPVAILSPVVKGTGEDSERCEKCGKLISEILDE